MVFAGRDADHLEKTVARVLGHAPRCEGAASDLVPEGEASPVDHASASTLQNDRVVFNIGGGKYRLVVAVKYEGPNGKIFVRFIGNHQQYDEIDAETV